MGLTLWRCRLALLLLGLAVAAFPASAAPTTVVLERTAALPPGWRFHSNASASDTISLYIALREPGIHELKTQLSQRHSSRGADGRRRDPGPHLSRAQVGQLRQPGRVAAEAVAGWLRSSGIRNAQTQGTSFVRFDASARTVKSLFQADLAYYAHGTTGKPVLRALSYTVPRWLRSDIDFVHPLTNFMPPHSSRTKPHHKPRPTPTPKPAVVDAVGDDDERELDMPCLTGTFPECIKNLYNITYRAAAPSPARFGVAGFLEQWILYRDVAGFMDVYAPELAATANFTVELFNNAINPQDSPYAAGMEASLDVEYALALGHPAAVTYYVTGGRGTKLDANGTALSEAQSDNEPYLEFFAEMLAKPDAALPHVLSISYADDEQGVPRAYAARVCDMIAALTARGVSVLAATGDAGAAGTGQTQCVSNDGAARRVFVPTFPASCPYVTAVGATENVGPPLTGADFSSGGFSDYFARPAWQDDAVAPYVADMVDGADPRLAWFNRSGRAVPDISAIGSGFQIQYGGNTAEVLGTSASTPTLAAMVALVNDARLRAGKPSLGWLNPLLYAPSVREVLRDVTVGDSGGCHFPDDSISPGWSSVVGYDCVTGLGTVGDFNNFLAALA
ncbi:peptidase S8/S53 domain-containing protein [Lasiosphaeria miniovina]|uniref:tripeptidyl-peptidase II n=1 Tax=Lasiosphaeria miniovina TaxID=1954250 RepID=A0AA40DYN6_9PEZI|nr:peptidase S8/S53 domain-containing protein [Lasiosphaeria miniovina]KAK0717816.1 peptidase S8/S53 domain-containing protein [Lasiosphaeria miniovina]